MKLKRLSFKNFHGFENRQINLDDQFTVLVGDNRSGKTAVLDGIAVAVGGFLSGFKDVGTIHIRANEVRRVAHPKGETIKLEPQYPTVVSCTGSVNREEFTWSRSLESLNGKTRTIPREIVQFAKQWQDEIRAGSDDILPVFSYLGTKRSGDVRRNKRNDEFGSRFIGYLDCLEPNSSEKLFMNWFKNIALQEFYDKKEPDLLKAVREAVANCLKSDEFDSPSPVTLRLHRENMNAEEELLVVLPDGAKLPFRFLSDGYQNIVRIVTDIAFRMALLNPQLGVDVVKKTPGIVLIDELDIYLHPHWQRRIVDDLKKTFPEVQFVVTTHSPFIIQSLEEHELRRLDDPDSTTIEEVPASSFVNKSLEDVAEDVQRVKNPSRNHKLQKLYEVTKHYYSLIDQLNHAEKEEEKNRLQQAIHQVEATIEELDAVLSNDENIAYHAILELERRDLMRGRKDETD